MTDPKRQSGVPDLDEMGLQAFAAWCGTTPEHAATRELWKTAGARYTIDGWNRVARFFADTIHSLQERCGELERDNKALTEHLDDCVQDRLSEINAEAEAYDRDASKTLAQICENLPEFDWNDYAEGLTTQDAYDLITEHITALETALAPGGDGGEGRVTWHCLECDKAVTQQCWRKDCPLPKGPLHPTEPDRPLTEDALSGWRTHPVIEAVAAERARQVAIEGWDDAHDDDHGAGDLALAASCYAIPHHMRTGRAYEIRGTPELWPWGKEWWKPKDYRRDLVRAAALIVAEIERLDRGNGSLAEVTEPDRPEGECPHDCFDGWICSGQSDVEPCPIHGTLQGKEGE